MRNRLHSWLNHRLGVHHWYSPRLWHLVHYGLSHRLCHWRGYWLCHGYRYGGCGNLGYPYRWHTHDGGC